MFKIALKFKMATLLFVTLRQKVCIMKSLYFFLAIVTIFSSSCDTKKQQEVKETPTEVAVAETPETTIPVVNFEEFKAYIYKNDNKTYIVNFWATWCAPCVKELPYFEAVHKKYADQNVEVLFVSLDFNLKKLNSFLAKHPLSASQVLLDDPDQNAWIPKISKTWSGAIPATIIYNKDKRTFFERSFTQEALEEELQSFIKS